MSKPTPRPWEIWFDEAPARLEIIRADSYKALRGGRSRADWIAELDCDSSGHDEAENAANAELIVRAVNEYDVLRARVEELEKALVGCAEALREQFPCGQIAKDGIACTRRVGHPGQHETSSGSGLIGWGDEAGRPGRDPHSALASARDALSSPAPKTTALGPAAVEKIHETMLFVLNTCDCGEREPPHPLECEACIRVREAIGLLPLDAPSGPQAPSEPRAAAASNDPEQAMEEMAALADDARPDYQNCKWTIDGLWVERTARDEALAKFVLANVTKDLGDHATTAEEFEAVYRIRSLSPGALAREFAAKGEKK